MKLSEAVQQVETDGISAREKLEQIAQAYVKWGLDSNRGGEGSQLPVWLQPSTPRLLAFTGAVVGIIPAEILRAMLASQEEK